MITYTVVYVSMGIVPRISPQFGVKVLDQDGGAVQFSLSNSSAFKRFAVIIPI